MMVVHMDVMYQEMPLTLIVDVDSLYQEMLLTLTKILFLKRYIVEELMYWRDNFE